MGVPGRAVRVRPLVSLLLVLAAGAVCAACGAAPLVAVRTSANPVTKGWRIVSFHGVHINIPSTWPVVDGVHAASCGSPFATTPTAFVGDPWEIAPACPLPSVATDHPRDGAWLLQSPAPSAARTAVTKAGQTVRVVAPGAFGPANFLWYHGVEIEIGIGPRSDVAQAIFDSIGYTAGLADTPVEQACARNPTPDRMPTPERATQALVLNRGDVTIGSLRPADQPTVTAQQVWENDAAHLSLERYRLILARYSAAYPALQNPDGSLTPESHDVLAWVVYSAPYSTTVAGCGRRGVDAVDAVSGDRLASAGWTPGP
jgi:hypothetical protein